MSEEIRLSRTFIEQELPKAPPLYVSVYLMTLVVGQDSKLVAEKLHATESDVLRAWAYWLDRGISQETKTEEAQKTQSSPVSANAAQKLLVSSERPVYSAAELAEYRKREDVRNLFFTAQRKLGKMLSHQDMSTIFSFHDWLGLPLEVIELLLSYCTENGHKGMRYIEKVAMGWSEEGIDTEDKAIAHIEMRKTGFRMVMQAFGQGNRMPLEKEEGFIRKWLQEYRLPVDVVKVACERTVLNTGKPSFAYADKILEQWQKAGVKTEADIAKLDEAFAASKANKAQQTQQTQQGTPKEPPKPKQNRFINYTQSEWDFEELERLEREQREKW